MAQDRSVIDSLERPAEKASPIGLYGGTFDPIHRGHIHAAKLVLKHIQLDKMHMILSARPGHRGEPASSIEDRWAMLQLACNGEERLIADDGEIRRQGKSYTFDTVKGYCDQGFVPNWVVGMDSFLTMPDWYRWQEIPEFCNLVVIQRTGVQEKLPEQLIELLAERQVDTLDTCALGQIWLLDAPMLDVSATEIRRRIVADEDASDLLDDAVWTYIRQHNLYAEVSV